MTRRHQSGGSKATRLRSAIQRLVLGLCRDGLLLAVNTDRSVLGAGDHFEPFGVPDPGAGRGTRYRCTQAPPLAKSLRCRESARHGSQCAA